MKAILIDISDADLPHLPAAARAILTRAIISEYRPDGTTSYLVCFSDYHLLINTLNRETMEMFPNSPNHQSQH